MVSRYLKNYFRDKVKTPKTIKHIQNESNNKHILSLEPKPSVLGHYIFLAV